nr:RNA-directed DNA polymerase, eukaryota [Tanacetum cinerariifolium]
MSDMLILQEVKSLTSKEDLTQKISKSIFVTNFPDHISARDLWGTCKAYGTVLDVYIPYKKSKAGKRFAFVRFIKVKNLDRLVANLCTIWISSYHLQANIVRYQRERKTYDSQNSFKRNVRISSDSFKGNVGDYSNSFASVLKSDRDFNLSLMGKVKDITALPNLYVILKEEGFQNFKISYLGGMWVLIELESSTASQKFIKHAGVGSWFSSLQPASNSFVSDERIVWISIEGLPLKVWSFNTFVEVASKWGELVEWKNIEDNNFFRKQLCVKTKLNEIICERFKVIIQGNVHWVRAKEMEGCDSLLRNEDYASSSSDEENEQENEGSRNEENKESNVQSEDPFNIYDLLNKNKESDGNFKEGELKCPPGFTPKETSVNEVHEKEMRLHQKRWDGECVIMGDFNEVRSEHERYGSVFNVQSVVAFNNFISLASLIDLPLDGYAYTWVHKFATKMSKLDRFLISKGLMASFPHLSSICLDNHLSDHRPILMREMNIDYGATPFRFFHSWFQIEGFDKLVEDTWMHMDITYSNGMILLKKKLQALKIIDQGGSNEVILNDRSILLKEIHDIISMDLEEMAQKEKVRWAIEGDENSKYFHGILNNKRSHLAIRGVLVNGDWIVKSNDVKNEFLNHFLLNPIGLSLIESV